MRGVMAQYAFQAGSLKDGSKMAAVLKPRRKISSSCNVIISLCGFKRKQLWTFYVTSMSRCHRHLEFRSAEVIPLKITTEKNMYYYKFISKNASTSSKYLRMIVENFKVSSLMEVLTDFGS